jgi:hypothetical protein
MGRAKIGVGLGVVAGVVDAIPMVVQGLPWSAVISAMTMWVVVGFLISTSDLRMSAIAKGLLISFLVLASPAVLIAWNDPMSLIPIGIMTTVLGSVLGIAVHRLTGSERSRQAAE